MQIKPAPRPMRLLLSVATAIAGLGSVGSSFAGSPAEARPKRDGSQPADRSSTAKTTGARLEYIDRLIRDGWASGKVKSSGIARDEEFLRRAYIDVLGRIPSIAGPRRSSAPGTRGSAPSSSSICSPIRTTRRIWPTSGRSS